MSAGLKRKSGEKESDIKEKKTSYIAPIRLNLNSQSEEEEIPMEAKIRMRNLGRYTPTSCGPNSFGKSRYGFIDRRALLNRQVDAQESGVCDDE